MISTNYITRRNIAVAYDNSGKGEWNSLTQSLNAPITVGAKNNRLLLVGVAKRFVGTCTSMKLRNSGQSFTNIASSSVDCGLELWYLTNPNSGNDTVEGKYSTNTIGNIVVGSFYNVNQSSPYSNVVSKSSATGTTTAGITVSSATNNLVIDFIGSADGPTGYTASGSNHALILAATVGDGEDGAMGMTTGSATTNPGWTWTGTAGYAMFGLSLNKV